MRAYPLRTEYLISYDIIDNKVRACLFKELNRYGLKHTQKSVFWGYLTVAELQAIKRWFDTYLEDQDKAFITQTNFNKHGQSYYFGHNQEDFKDWKETDVL